MRELIFDVAERHDQRPAEHSESTFAFLNRVAGDFWEHPRRLLQEWADHVSVDGEYNELRQRLRSRDDDQFRSAFLELYLYESLLRLGYAVTIHPPVPGTSRRPDFLGERGDERLYVEAIAPGTAADARAAASRRGVLFDTVNRLRHPGFMVWLERLEEGDSPPASARLREDLRRWLDALDPNAITNIKQAPVWTWSHGGWSATFRPIPKRLSARGPRADDRSIGVYGQSEASFVDDAPGIRRALEQKHRAYGDLKAPFVIAIGTYNFDTDRWHSTNALYGSLGIQWYETPGGRTATREVRQPGGYFGQPPHWRNRKVSAVLVVNQLMPYSVPRVEATLWRHPRPFSPLPDQLGLPATALAFCRPTLAETKAPVPPAQFFGLPEEWPPGTAWVDG